MSRHRILIVAAVLLAGVLTVFFVLRSSETGTPTSDPAAGSSPTAVEAGSSPTAVDPGATIEGVFRARIGQGELEDFSYLPDYFGGRWTLTVSSDQYVLEGPIFRVTEQIVQTSDEEWAIDATPAPNGAFNCFDDGGARLIGEGEASGTYGVTLDGSELSLVPREERCALRAVLLERTWTRVE